MPVSKPFFVGDKDGPSPRGRILLSKRGGLTGFDGGDGFLTVNYMQHAITEERQIMALLTMAAGALELINRTEKNDPISPLVDHVALKAAEVLRKYPLIGKVGQTKRWIKEKNAEWKAFGDEGMVEWSPCVLATMASNIYEDLRGRVRYPAMVVALEGLRDTAASISYHFADSVGDDEYLHYKDADLMLEQMYRVVGWER